MSGVALIQQDSRPVFGLFLCTLVLIDFGVDILPILRLIVPKFAHNWHTVCASLHRPSAEQWAWHH